MKSGMLVSQFSTEGDFGAAAIRYLTVSDISHVDLVLPWDVTVKGAWYRKGSLLGARLVGGVQIRPVGYAKFTRTVTVGCTVPDIDAAMQFALAQVGEPYDKGAILDFFLHRMHKDRHFNTDQSSWFCDELNYSIYSAGGVNLLGADCPKNLTPQMELLSPYWKTAQG